MKAVAIYVEGGGKGANVRAELRKGLDALLGPQRDAARARLMRWKVVPCGTRSEACRAFSRADVESRVLLVDAEGPVDTSSPPSPADRVSHLRKLGYLSDEVEAARVHLAVELLETWVVADSEELAKHYGQGFRANCLPTSRRLDDVPKRDIERALRDATRETKKGTYVHSYAGRLLEVVSPDTVASRCTSFRTFRQWLDEAIERAT